MNDTIRQHYDTQSRDLRIKIKTWEAVFQREHDGNKPSKDDIKANPKIAATYKEYQKVRKILDGKIPLPQRGEDNKENRQKRKSPNPPPSFTPSTKRFKQIETPSSRLRDSAQRLGHYTPWTAVTPSLSRKLFSPVVPTSIGPTPQRDGRVLGIFDHLPFKDAEIDSPCKPNASTKLSFEEIAVQETPRKSTKTTSDTTAPGRTPSSRHKISQQQTPRRSSILSTPLKPHDGNRVAKTPSTSSSVSRLQFATPAFLRRIPMAKITESSEYVSPEPIRLPRKPLFRGLSSVVADLRKLQEEKMDDELDALRDMENEAGGSRNSDAAKEKDSLKKADSAVAAYIDGAQENTVAIANDDISQKTAKEAKKKEAEAAILALDQIALLGGFDDEAQFDDIDGKEGDAGLDRNGRPLRVYKKKGQKRTTRKSNMRPVRAKKPTITTRKEPSEEAEEEDVAPETQEAAEARHREDPAQLSGSDFAASGDDEDEDELARDMPPISRKTIRKPASVINSKTATEDKVGDKSESKIKKTARKVNEFAHANFRRLKLRNNGAKGGPGYNSRFRRRR